ncbi:MAG: phosphatase PAP2 family protein [Candidatus Diapherotrites archaeon]|nr:phosphatase PAP2 family protein [Candidatus Diapherotrites archaeon]
MFESILPFDIAFSLAVQSWINPAFTLLMKGASFVFSSAGIMFIAAWLYWSKKEKESFYFISLIVFAAVVSEGLKNAFKRLRPSFYNAGINGLESHVRTDYSFPSGHSTLAGAVFAYLENGLEKNWKILVFTGALAVAFSRIYLGAHFLSDVIAGLVLGLLVGKFNLWFRKKTEHMHFRLSKIREELLLFSFIAASFLIVLFLQEFVLAAVVIGYFAGYSLWKELRFEQSGKSLKRKFLGFVGIGVLYFASRQGSPDQKFIVLAIMGFWVSFLFPLMFESFKHHLKKAKN